MIKTDECTLEFVCKLFADRDAYKRNRPTFKSSHEDWSQTRPLALEIAIMGHILFPQNPEEVVIGLLHFLEQIEQSHTFVLALIVDTITLCISKAPLNIS